MIKALFLTLFLLFSKNSYAGEFLGSGTSVPYDSYIFEVNKARELMTLIDFLEQDNLNKKNLLLQYERLDIEQNNKIQFLTDNNDLLLSKQFQYERLREADSKKIKMLETQNNISKITRWVFFGLGVGATTGSIYIANQITK